MPLETLFHLPTLLMCLLGGWIVFALYVTAIWYRNRTPELMLWSLGFWAGAIGVMVSAPRNIAPDWLTIGIGNLLMVACIGMVWQGFRAFDRQPLSYGEASAGALVWAFLYYLVPNFADNPNARVIVASLTVAGYSVLVAQTAWQGRLREPLPARTAVMLFFSGHAVIYFARVILTLLYPIEMKAGLPHSLWYSILLYEMFIHIVFSGIAVFALISERIELRYKIASETDALTNVLNRRAFLQRLSLRPAGPSQGALALMDLDHFKRVNDTGGHGAGDAVLCAYCALNASLLPDDAVFGRIGGEEFGVYLPSANIAAAQAFCERLRVAVEAMAVPFEGRLLTVTVSIGLCPTNDDNPAALLSLADKALYASKRSGRNRVTLMTETLGAANDTHADDVLQARLGQSG